MTSGITLRLNLNLNSSKATRRRTFDIAAGEARLGRLTIEMCKLPNIRTSHVILPHKGFVIHSVVNEKTADFRLTS